LENRIKNIRYDKVTNKKLIGLTSGANVIKYCDNLLQYLQFVRLKFYGKLLRYLSLQLWDKVIKLFPRVKHYHSMVTTKLI
jgi:hypothetical protein